MNNLLRAHAEWAIKSTNVFPRARKSSSSLRLILVAAVFDWLKSFCGRIGLIRAEYVHNLRRSSSGAVERRFLDRRIAEGESLWSDVEKRPDGETLVFLIQFVQLYAVEHLQGVGVLPSVDDTHVTITPLVLVRHKVWVNRDDLSSGECQDLVDPRKWWARDVHPLESTSPS
jgi:hypothetical protein